MYRLHRLAAEDRRIVSKAYVYVCMLLVLYIFIINAANAKTMSSGWTYPTNLSNTCFYLKWMKFNRDFKGYHLGVDVCNAATLPVYSIGKGEVLKSELHGGYGCNGKCAGGTVLARYQAKDGTWFTVLYGHIDKDRLPKIGNVKAGDIIGYTASDWAPPHLHFSIHYGKIPLSNWYLGYTSKTSNTYGFVDPFLFLNAHPMKSATSDNSKPDEKTDSPTPVVTPAPDTQPTGTIIAPIINNLLLGK